MIKTAVILLTLVTSVPKEPTLKHVKGSLYKAINPLREYVDVVIDCGMDFEHIDTVMSPGTSEELDIKQPDGTAAYCHLLQWKRL